MEEILMKMTPRELNKQLHGVCVISITPFKEDGAFDAKGYEKNLRPEQKQRDNCGGRQHRRVRCDEHC